MRVVHVASEIAPFAQSGGLADVLGGLPPALAALGVTTGVIAPLYRGVEAKLTGAGILLERQPIEVHVGPHTFSAALCIGRTRGVALGFVDCAPLYDRPGGLYGPTGNSDFGDNHLRFGVLGKVAVEHAAALVGDPPDVIHAHDWQGGSAPIYARVANTPAKLVMTIHNLAYRGIVGKYAINDLGFPWSLFDLHHLEFYDQLSLLKGGLAVADAVTTVSPTYAKEIVTPAFGEALDSFLAYDVKRLVGIVNGIDVEAWDPQTDGALTAHFSASALAGKAVCRAALAHELGLEIADSEPLVAVIARMTGQKGLDLIADIVPELSRIGARLVVLGSGEPDLESRFRYLGDAFHDHVAVRIGFDISLSRRIYAGCDLFLMPSRFEPCGLGQLYAMRYGALPIAHAVGGLVDTIDDMRTGVKFHAPSASELLRALERGAQLFGNKVAFTEARRHAMERDSSWTASAKQYAALYESL